MDPAGALIESLDQLPFDLEAISGVALSLGPIDLALALSERLRCRIIAAAPPGAKARRLAGRLQARSPFATIVSPRLTPLRPKSVSALFAADALERDDPGFDVGHWSKILRPEGLLVISEKVRSGGRFRRRLLAAEDLTCLLLNHRYIEIGQRWPVGQKIAVTFGLSRA